MKATIIKALMHAPGLRFNELWNKQGPSNAFAYHLKKLEEEGTIHKQGETYFLTEAGKQEAAYIQGETGKTSTYALPTATCMIHKENKFLMIKRTKEPFYGYYVFPSGKIDINSSPLETAKKELAQETGITDVELQIAGIRNWKTIKEDKVTYNHLLLAFTGQYEGSTESFTTREGSTVWVLNLKLVLKLL